MKEGDFRVSWVDFSVWLFVSDCVLNTVLRTQSEDKIFSVIYLRWGEGD